MLLQVRASVVLPGWRAVAVRGAVALLFGVVALGLPGLTLAALSLTFGLYALADGLLTLGLGAALRRSDRPWLLSVEGVVGIAVGLCALVWRGPTVLVMTILVGAWATVTGALEIVVAARLRETLTRELSLVVAGASSMALGALLLVFPQVGGVVLVLALGAYASAFGLAMLLLATRLRRWERHALDHRPATAWDGWRSARAP